MARSLAVGRVVVFRARVAATVPRERLRLQRRKTLVGVSGFARCTAAVVEGELCGYRLRGMLRSRAGGLVDGRRGQGAGAKARPRLSTRADGWPRQSTDIWLDRRPTEGVNPATQLLRPAEHLAVLSPGPKQTPTPRTQKCRRPGPRRARAPGARRRYEACGSRSPSREGQSSRSRSLYNWTQMD